VGIRFADRVTPLYPQKLALPSPTGGGLSVGIVRLRTKATEFVCLYICVRLYIYIFLIVANNTGMPHLNIRNNTPLNEGEI